MYECSRTSTSLDDMPAILVAFCAALNEDLKNEKSSMRDMLAELVSPPIPVIHAGFLNPMRFMADSDAKSTADAPVHVLEHSYILRSDVIFFDPRTSSIEYSAGCSANGLFFAYR